jgi:hypothetical protein
MPRPKNYTTVAHQERLGALPERKDYVADQSCDHAKLLKNYLGLDATPDQVRELAWLMASARDEYRRLLNIAGTKATPGEMHAAVEKGRERARALLEWSNSLPPGMFSNSTTLMPGEPPLRTAIEAVAQTFDRLAEMHARTRGRPPGRRSAARSVAPPFLSFAYRHAPKIGNQSRIFVWGCLCALGIECPNPFNHSPKFVRWVRPLEKSAKRGAALSIVRERARALLAQQEAAD